MWKVWVAPLRYTAPEVGPAGIRPADTINAYRKRMGEDDTPEIFWDAPQEFTGDEFAPFSPVRITGKEIPSSSPNGPCRDEVVSYARAHLIGKSFTNAATDEQWRVTRATIGHILSQGRSPESRRIVAAIPELIRTAEHAETRAPKNQQQPNLKHVRVFESEAQIGDHVIGVRMFVKTFDQSTQPINGMTEIHVLYDQNIKAKGPSDQRVGSREGIPRLPNKGPSGDSIGQTGGEVKPESFENDRRIEHDMVDGRGRVRRPADPPQEPSPDDFAVGMPAGQGNPPLWFRGKGRSDTLTHLVNPLPRGLWMA